MSWTKCPSFSVEVKGDVKEVIDKATKEGKKKNVIISGNEKKGTIKHSDIIDGTYTVKMDEKTKVATISFDISEDSIFIACKDVKDTVSKYFEGK